MVMYSLTTATKNQFGCKKTLVNYDTDSPPIYKHKVTVLLTKRFHAAQQNLKFKYSQKDIN